MDAFRTAMARFPSGVTIVTTQDANGTPHGFTASSFCSVSLDPPLVLVCLGRSAKSYPVFDACERFAVSILRPQHTELARRFASKNVDKFAGGHFVRTASGLTAVEGALVLVECIVHNRHDGGDHVIIVGRVDRTLVGDGDPIVYFNRGFGTITELGSHPTVGHAVNSLRPRNR